MNRRRGHTPGSPGQKPNVRRECAVCGEVFERYISPSKLKSGVDNPRYCSLVCKGKAFRGENHPMWQGGRIEEEDGYIMIHCPEHPHANNKGYVFEHRLVMEATVGRYLLPTEVVHHIDENRSNNLIENLRLYSSNGEHLAGHHGIDAETVLSIRALSAQGLPQSLIAGQLGIVQATVSRVITGERWSHIKEG